MWPNKTVLFSGYMSLIYYSFFNGFVGVFVKLVHDMDALSIVFFRAAIAAAFIGLVVVLQGQSRLLRPCYLRSTLLVAVLQGGMIILIMIALRQTSVANALFLLYTAPVFSVLLAGLFLKERITRSTWLSIGVALIGILCIVDPRSLSLGSEHALGNLLALGAGLSLAAMTVSAKTLSSRMSAYYIVFWQYLLIAGLVLPFVRIDTPTTVLSNWWQLSGLGIVCTGFAFLWYMRGVRKVPTQHVLVVTSLEPLIGTLFAAVLLHESLSPLALAGAGLILLSAYNISQTQSGENEVSTPEPPPQKLCGFSPVVVGES